MIGLTASTASESPAPQLSRKWSGSIVNNGVVYIAYQFEPDWDTGVISEDDRAEPVQAWLLMVRFYHICFFWFILLDTLLFVSVIYWCKIQNL